MKPSRCFASWQFGDPGNGAPSQNGRSLLGGLRILDAETHRKTKSRQTGILTFNHGHFLDCGHFLDYSFVAKKLVATWRQLRGLRFWILGAQVLPYLLEPIPLCLCPRVQLEGLIMDNSEFRLPPLHQSSTHAPISACSHAYHLPIWRFPEIGLPLNHPFLVGDFP